MFLSGAQKMKSWLRLQGPALLEGGGSSWSTVTRFFCCLQWSNKPELFTKMQQRCNRILSENNEEECRRSTNSLRIISSSARWQTLLPNDADDLQSIFIDKSSLITGHCGQPTNSAHPPIVLSKHVFFSLIIFLLMLVMNISSRPFAFLLSCLHLALFNFHKKQVHIMPKFIIVLCIFDLFNGVFSDLHVKQDVSTKNLHC